MAQLTIEIPNDKVAYAVEGFLKVNPHREFKPNPDFISSEETPGIPEFLDEPLYSDAEHIRRVIMKKIIDDVKRGHELIAYQNINVQKDENLVR